MKTGQTVLEITFFTNTIDRTDCSVIQCITEKGVLHMTISLRLSDEDSTLIKKYAELKNMTVSEMIRQTVLERIEDEFDLTAYNKAMEEYKNNPVTYTHEEVKKMLELK